MSFFARTALLSAKRLLRRPGGLLLLVLLPLVCGVLGGYFASGQEAVLLRVGVVLTPGDPFTQVVYDGMETEGAPVVFSRYRPEDLALLEGQVASGALECAFILEPGAPDQAYLGRWRDKVTLIKSPATVGHVLAGEMLFASFFRECGPLIGQALLEELLEVPSAQAADYMAERFAHYRGADIFMEPEFSTVTVAGQTAAPSGGARPLHGLIALFGAATALYCLPVLIRERDSLLPRLGRRQARGYLLGTACALAALCAAQGALGLGALALTCPAALGSPAAEVGWLLAYTLAIALAGTGACLLLPKGELLYGGAPFLLLLTAVLGGVFVDMGEIGPLFGALSRLFPSAGYLAGVLGRGRDAAVLGAFGGAGLGLVLLLPLGPRRTR